MSEYDDIREKRKKLQEQERLEMSMYHFVLKGQRERFEQAEHLLHFQTDQNQADTLLLYEKFLEWDKKAKPDSEQKKILNQLIGALMRVNAYTMTVESSAKNAVGEYLRDRHIVKNYESNIRNLEIQNMQKDVEIDNLKKEIEKLNKQLDFK